ncbi:DEAD-box ATP-dependent RNA helicase 7 [Platanthera zijinensis]|uniref:RNA helicase n=1 Tax=Platanthera zijinensis TaxID=2320716 RepID=A0AAP0BPD1_9ASPA
MPSIDLPNKMKMKQAKSMLEATEMKTKKRKTAGEKKEAVDTTLRPKKPRVVEKSYNDDDEDDDLELTGSGEEESGHTDQNALSNFRISKALVEKLNSNGIYSLFPIQAKTFDIVLEGYDLLGQARTGQGKTLAFILPILESLTNCQHEASKKIEYGRSPSVLVLLPTRELANQVHAEFEAYGSTVGLFSCCLCGGLSDLHIQRSVLKRGVDVVIGTPGRIKDHINNESLNLKSVKIRVLDEADELLQETFFEDVNCILGEVGDVSKVQTLLFSATISERVKKVSSKFQKDSKKTVDLVSNEKMKASASVRHVIIPCSTTSMPRIIPDLVICHSRGGRTIIFTETQKSASQLSGCLPGAQALHGGIVQSQRKVILTGFTSGKFLVLVATNLAARGLDIKDVQLIIQCEPPRDVEDYIHRSGRTGRAGNTGVSIMLYEPRCSYMVRRIEKQAGVKFELISAPQLPDIAEIAGSDAADAIMKVSDSLITVFHSHAKMLKKKTGLSALDLLAKALAKAAGCSVVMKRSILSSLDDHVTLHLDAGKRLSSPTFAFSILEGFMPQKLLGGIKHLSITTDSMGAVFDVPADDASSFIEAGQQNSNMVKVEVLQKLPALQERESNASFGGHGGRFSGRGGRFGSRGGRFGGRGGRFGGRGNFGGNNGRFIDQNRANARGLNSFNRS